MREIFLNGEGIKIDQTIQSLQDLLLFNKLANQRVAIEVNGNIIPRSLFNQTKINANDKIEIIKAVGGG